MHPGIINYQKRSIFFPQTPFATRIYERLINNDIFIYQPTYLFICILYTEIKN